MVMGDKGCYIRQLEKDTNTEIVVSKRGEFYHGKDGERVIALVGFSAESLIQGFDFIQDRIDRDRLSTRTGAQCILVVSDDASGRIVGPRGLAIQKLISQYAQLNVNIQKSQDMNKLTRERFVEILSRSGNLDDVRECAKQLIRLVCEPGLNQTVARTRYPVKSTGLEWYDEHPRVKKGGKQTTSSSPPWKRLPSSSPPWKQKEQNGVGSINNGVGKVDEEKEDLGWNVTRSDGSSWDFAVRTITNGGGGKANDSFEIEEEVCVVIEDKAVVEYNKKGERKVRQGYSMFSIENKGLGNFVFTKLN